MSALDNPDVAFLLKPFAKQLRNDLREYGDRHNLTEADQIAERSATAIESVSTALKNYGADNAEFEAEKFICGVLIERFGDDSGIDLGQNAVGIFRSPRVSAKPDPSPSRKSRLTPDRARAERFHIRAKWLNDELDRRKWNKHTLQSFEGPNNKTTQKILEGLWVQDDVLRKVASGLSKYGRGVDQRFSVNVEDIPEG